MGFFVRSLRSRRLASKNKIGLVLQPKSSEATRALRFTEEPSRRRGHRLRDLIREAIEAKAVPAQHNHVVNGAVHANLAHVVGYLSTHNIYSPL